MKKILVLHGPKLNRLGSREPSLYGTTTLEELNKALSLEAEGLGAMLNAFQSNSECELIEAIHKAADAHIDRRAPQGRACD